MFFTLLLCSTNRTCTECCLEVIAVIQLSNASWVVFPIVGGGNGGGGGGTDWGPGYPNIYTSK